MCGIAGIVGRAGEPPSREALSAMGCALAHRGPDEASLEIHGQAGLSFRRLSIIDVAGGQQPLHNEDDSCHLILNGEIYNHLEMRRELEARGHRPRTHSDAEVVLHGYEEWGEDVVPRLRGMFAFALWDDKRRRLLLARDRLGKKPLVYHEAGGRLAFASELGGLLADPQVPREPDLDAIHQYLVFQYVPAPLTAFAGVRKLPPAHTLVFEDGVARVQRYWSLSFQPILDITLEEAAVEVRRLLRDAVAVRLMSEVPLGAFLSGGVDSSAVVALMSEFGRVKTFCIGFEEDAYDERPYAAMMASRYGTDHHEFVVRPDATEVLPSLVAHYGEPFADSSALPTWYLARLTRAHVTVALNGDGGDELFAGYDRYRALAAYRLLAHLPGRGLLGPMAEAADGWLPSRARRLLQAASTRPEISYARTVSVFSPEEVHALYSPEMRRRKERPEPYAPLLAAFDGSDAPDLLGRTLYADTVTYLPGDLLAKVDIATMAHGLEARSPLLDHPLVEFAARLPSRYKLGRTGKFVLRRAVEDLLPTEILRRPKKGFGVPLGRWFRGELRGYLEDMLLSPRARARPFFDPVAVRRLIDTHGTRRDRSAQLWALLVLELWARRFLDAQDGHETSRAVAATEAPSAPPLVHPLSSRAPSRRV
jgi:asparagine synthase (glutamine-hydrolysing)